MDIEKKGFKLNKYSSFTTNMSSLITKNTFEGKEHLVVPTVLIVEGVFNDVLYKKEQLGRFPKSWDGVPVFISHPRDEWGKEIPAQTPEIVEKESVGRLWNTTFEFNKLKGEVWIDVEKCKNIAPQALRMLENNEKIEVSTSMFTDDEMVQGVQDNKEYLSIAHNLRPNHLAILLDEEGACNWDDGGGMPRINKKVQAPNVTGDNYTNTKKRESSMDRTEKIKALVASGAWSKEETKFLTDLEDKQFEKIATLSKKPEPKVDEKLKKELEDFKLALKTNEKTKKELEDVKKELKTLKEKAEPKKVVEKTLDELLNLATPELKSSILHGVETYRVNKAKIVSGLLTNKRNKFTEDELKSKDVEELEKLTELSMTEVDYSAQNGGLTVNIKKEEVPEPPIMEW